MRLGVPLFYLEGIMYLQKHIDELNTRIEAVRNLEQSIAAIAPTVKLDAILEKVKDVDRFDQFSKVREVILGLFTDEDLRNAFSSVEDIYPIRDIANEVFNSSTDIVKDRGTESPERRESHLLHEIISAFTCIAYEAITGKTSRRGNSKTIREIFSS